MFRYKIIDGPARFHAGQVIGLSEEQALARRHAVEPFGDDWFVTGDIEFKTGEEIGLREAPDTLPGVISARLELVATAKPAKTRKKAEADA